MHIIGVEVVEFAVLVDTHRRHCVLDDDRDGDLEVDRLFPADMDLAGDLGLVLAVLHLAGGLDQQLGAVKLGGEAAVRQLHGFDVDHAVVARTEDDACAARIPGVQVDRIARQPRRILAHEHGEACLEAQGFDGRGDRGRAVGVAGDLHRHAGSGVFAGGDLLVVGRDLDLLLGEGDGLAALSGHHQEGQIHREAVFLAGDQLGIDVQRVAGDLGGIVGLLKVLVQAHDAELAAVDELGALLAGHQHQTRHHGGVKRVLIGGLGGGQRIQIAEVGHRGLLRGAQGVVGFPGRLDGVGALDGDLADGGDQRLRGLHRRKIGLIESRGALDAGAHLRIEVQVGKLILGPMEDDQLDVHVIVKAVHHAGEGGVEFDQLQIHVVREGVIAQIRDVWPQLDDANIAVRERVLMEFFKTVGEGHAGHIAQSGKAAVAAGAGHGDALLEHDGLDIELERGPGGGGGLQFREHAVLGEGADGQRSLRGQGPLELVLAAEEALGVFRRDGHGARGLYAVRRHTGRDHGGAGLMSGDDAGGGDGGHALVGAGPGDRADVRVLRINGGGERHGLIRVEGRLGLAQLDGFGDDLALRVVDLDAFLRVDRAQAGAAVGRRQGQPAGAAAAEVHSGDCSADALEAVVARARHGFGQRELCDGLEITKGIGARVGDALLHHDLLDRVTEGIERALPIIVVVHGAGAADGQHPVCGHGVGHRVVDAEGHVLHRALGDGDDAGCGDPVAGRGDNGLAGAGRDDAPAAVDRGDGRDGAGPGDGLDVRVLGEHRGLQHLRAVGGHGQFGGHLDALGVDRAAQIVDGDAGNVVELSEAVLARRHMRHPLTAAAGVVDGLDIEGAVEGVVSNRLKAQRQAHCFQRGAKHKAVLADLCHALLEHDFFQRSIVKEEVPAYRGDAALDDDLLDLRFVRFKFRAHCERVSLRHRALAADGEHAVLAEDPVHALAAGAVGDFGGRYDGDGEADAGRALALAVGDGDGLFPVGGAVKAGDGVLGRVERAGGAVAPMQRDRQPVGREGLVELILGLGRHRGDLEAGDIHERGHFDSLIVVLPGDARPVLRRGVVIDRLQRGH